MEDDDNWDLFAVVRSCRLSGPPATTDPFSSFPPTPPPRMAPKAEVVEPPPEGEVAGPGGGGGPQPFAFPDLLKPRSSEQDLEELCKPFFPHQNPPSSIGSPPCSSSLLPAVSGTRGTQQQRQPHRPLSQISRSKRRKTQQKRVVCHVPADGLSSDMWAWRKYGQKPIKGSPFPRGYYRCSSSKGCLARKQVERSRTDPAMFVITYTAEHNHPMPTHRNSLAGSTRHKLSTPTASSAATPAASAGTGDRDGEHPSSSTAAELSPTTPLTASMEDELLRSRAEKDGDGDGDDEDGDDDEDEDEGMLFVEDMEVMGEDELLFMGSPETATAATAATTAVAAAALFDNDGGYGEHFLPPPWLSSGGGGNTAAAAGGS